MPQSTPQSLLLATSQVDIGAAAWETGDPVGAATHAAHQVPDLRELQQKLLRAVTSNHDQASALTAVSLVMSETVGPVRIVYLDRGADNSLRIYPWKCADESVPLPNVAETLLLAAGSAACDQGRQQTSSVSSPALALILAAPVILRGRLPEAVILVLPNAIAPLESLSCVTQLVAVHFTLWRILQGALVAEMASGALAAVLELLGKLESAADLSEVCHTVVGTVQSHLACERVALGLVDGLGSRCRLRAVSGVSRFEAHSEFARELEGALEESVVRGCEVQWPVPTTSTSGPGLALRALCASSACAAASSAPLKNQRGEVIGAWVILGSREVLEQPAVTTFLRASQASLGSCLQLWQSADQGIFYRLTRHLSRLCKSGRNRALIAVAAMLTVILALPIPYKVACECTLQPVTRRYVAAPFAGILDKSLVSPGDLVKVGDTLARLDEREIRLELAGVTADSNRARKQADAARAGHQLAEAQQAKLEMERLNLKIRLLTERAEHLEIKCPLDGIVVSGDLERAEGVPVSIGQALFEVAPLGQMTLELAVPEDDLAFVQEGAAASVRLEAYPSREWTGFVARIHPRGEIRNGRTVFIAELTLDNTLGRLRPGMNGTGKIVGPRQPLAWNLFHKAWEKAVTAIAW